MPTERQNMKFYLMTMIMFGLPHLSLVFETFAIGVCRLLTCTLERAKVERKYANRKPMHNLAEVVSIQSFTI